MHFTIPDQPSLLRKVLLAPATLLFAAGGVLHRALWLRPARNIDPEAIPVIVIGSLRAGGAGKTPVALALAKYLTSQGLRTAVLTYKVGNFGGWSVGPLGFFEVFPDSNWRASSDEAVLLARELSGTGARVFATRDRAKARSALATHDGALRDARPDVLIADDGLMDARLTRSPRVLRVALVRPGENPRLWDLLPAGPWRMTAAALGQVDVVLREGEGFFRTALPPRSLTPPTASTPQWVLTGLGNPQAFVRALKNSGVSVAGESHGPDHGLPNLTKARQSAQACGIHHFICSAKDAIKLESHPNRPENLRVVPESVRLSADFQRRVNAFLTPPTS